MQETNTIGSISLVHGQEWKETAVALLQEQLKERFVQFASSSIMLPEEKSIKHLTSIIFVSNAEITEELQKILGNIDNNSFVAIISFNDETFDNRTAQLGRFFSFHVKETTLNEDLFRITSSLSFELINYISSKNRPCIYVGETSQEYLEDMFQIRRELIHRGFKVVPSLLSSACVNSPAIITDSLDQASASVHIISNEIYTQNTDLPTLIELENKLANERFTTSESGSFKRFIWLPDNLYVASELYQIKIESLKRDMQLTSGAELIASPREKFKLFLLRKLLNETNEIPDASGENYILISDSYQIKHLGEAAGLKDSLKADLQLAYQKQNERTGKMQQRKQIRAASQLLLLYASENPNWLAIQLNEIRKARAFSKNREPLKIQTLTSHPEIFDKLLSKEELPLFNIVDINKGKNLDSISDLLTSAT